MEKSEQIDKLSIAIWKAQKELKPVVKDSYNSHFKSKYASLEAIWDACREALHSNDLCVIQNASYDGDYIVLQSMLLHTSGQYISSSVGHKPTKADIQALGSVITYLKRYALSGLVGISASDIDDDGEGTMDRSSAKKANAPSKEVVASIHMALSQAVPNGNKALLEAYAKLPQEHKDLVKKGFFEQCQQQAMQVESNARSIGELQDIMMLSADMGIKSMRKAYLELTPFERTLLTPGFIEKAKALAEEADEEAKGQ